MKYTSSTLLSVKGRGSRLQRFSRESAPDGLRDSRGLSARPGSTDPDTESGFTLIELMVVLLIMAILLAIAIPTFLGVRHSAQDRATQSNLRNALNAVKQLYTKDGAASYSGVTTTALASVEPSLTFVNGAISATNPGRQVSFSVTGASGQWIMLAGWSPDKKCWYVEDNEENGTTTAPVQVPGTWYGVQAESSPTGCNSAPGKVPPSLGAGVSPKGPAVTGGWGSSF
ncbi:MAG: type II secretion system protein [Actinomycetota bacterium]|jgi:type IV pilus assembly protein PilA|nr:type II secretion system protein [Actinomycetota bacterium]